MRWGTGRSHPHREERAAAGAVPIGHRRRMPAAVDAQNHVTLQGRLAAAPQERTLPSGDALVHFRVVVSRARPRDGGPTVDTLDCVAWTAALRKRLLRLDPGQEVAVAGALRRRFWRSERGSASRCEVEVTDVRRVPP